MSRVECSYGPEHAMELFVFQIYGKLTSLTTYPRLLTESQEVLLSSQILG